jgi:hypothetical protein
MKGNVCNPAMVISNLSTVTTHNSILDLRFDFCYVSPAKYCRLHNEVNRFGLLRCVLAFLS